jgi:RNA polymerase sigma-70 factor (ECF subfamily)
MLIEISFTVDEHLIEEIKAKNTEAFKRMYNAYIRYVYSIVIRYVRNSSDHQDLIQEIFALVFLKIESFNSNKGDFKIWLRKICINQCINYYHKNKQRIQIESLDTEPPTNIPDEDLQFELSRTELLAFLNAMPAGYREVFMLIVIDEYSHKEVGEILKISPETSRSQLHRAKQWLKENISQNTLKLLTHVSY